MKRILFFALILVIITGGYYVFRVEKRKSMKTPDGAVGLEFPLKGGSFRVVQSGRSGSVHALPVEKYALDIVRPTKISDFFKFRKSDLKSDSTFNTPVYSPCAGNVTTAIDNFSDMPIGIAGQAAEANRATVNCGQFYAAMVHFKKDSILVKVGDIVKIGQEIGLVGNSGFSSRPHLHFMAYQIIPSSNDKIALPITFNGKYLFRGDIYP